MNSTISMLNYDKHVNWVAAARLPDCQFKHLHPPSHSIGDPHPPLCFVLPSVPSSGAFVPRRTRIDRVRRDADGVPAARLSTIARSLFPAAFPAPTRKYFSRSCIEPQRYKHKLISIQHCVLNRGKNVFSFTFKMCARWRKHPQ